MEESKDNVQRPSRGMVTDVSPSDQPKETYRYALNAVNQTDAGGVNFLAMEKSIQLCTSFPANTEVINSIYMTDDLFTVFLTDGTNDYIGTVNKKNVFKLAVKTTVLGLSKKNFINGTFRVRRNSNKVIYWVDGFNKPRLFNFDRPFDFYSVGYIEYLKTHTIYDNYLYEKWSDIKFDLIKTYTLIPSFDSAKIIATGNIPSGSYSISIQLIDENLSPTEWITTSNPINIYIDPLSLDYSKIRGSRNSNSTGQNFQFASKTIEWTIGNLDTNFSFYRIAVLCANGGTGIVNKALVSNLIPITTNKFVYSGNDTDFTATPLQDIEKTKTDISSAKYIEQLENKLILASIKGKQIHWCNFQEFASKIKSNLVVNSNVAIDDIESVGSPKNPLSNFTMTGYMWGEVYSFGIVYIFKDGFKSPAYHIPGRPTGNLLSSMDFYECQNDIYPAIHSCNGDYWGTEGYTGNNENIVGKKIRHHKFPKRNGDLFRESVNQISQGTVDRLAVSLTIVSDLSYLDGLEGGQASYTVTIADDSSNVIGSYYGNINSSYISGTPIDIGTYNSKYNATITHVVFDDVSLLGSPDFTFTSVEEEINLSVTNNITDMCGIKFTNVERPHPDVIGFEIVRNERTDDDKLIVDNALVGVMTTDDSSPYKTFGLVAPDLADSKKATDSVFIFSPEHQFRNKKISFDSFDVIGVYDRSAKFFPERDTAGGRGLYIQDVQAGSSFNSTYDKGTDPDGFDLQVLYRSNEFIYSSVNGNGQEVVQLPINQRLLFLSAAGNSSIDTSIYFNASIDNKIMVATFDSVHQISNSLFTHAGVPRLLYVSLIKNNISAYANFINKTYYQETNNPSFFGENNITTSDVIFNGDAYVAPMTINSSTFYDTHISDPPKKKGVWKIIAGAVLIAVGAAALIFSGGASSALIAAGIGLTTATAALVITTATILAFNYGISMLTSGIQFDTMKNMIDQHYEAGLKDTIKDVDNKNENYNNEGKDDDRFQWFVDRLQNIYFESSVNIGLRSGLTIGCSDFINSPSIQPSEALTGNSMASKDTFEVYLSNKFTIIDREQNDGRLYLGYAVAEFYDMNIDYLRKNHEKPNYYLPIEYDCCSLSSKIEDFNNRIFYSEQAFQEEQLDNYRNFLPNNYKDIEGHFGEITNIFRFNNTLYIHTTESLLVLPQNMQERINQELVTFIGTGEFFAIPPRKVMDGENGAFGSSDQKATVVTKNGVFFVNTREGTPYMLGQVPKDISNGNSIWFKENLRVQLHDAIKAAPILYYNSIPVAYAEEVYDSNDNDSVGVHAIYDTDINRILITKIDYLPILPITLYSSTESAGIGVFKYDPLLNKFYYGYVTGEREITLDDKVFFENKSWTMSYSLETQTWISYHSYIPKIYMATQSGLYSAVGSNLYKHNISNKFCWFYDTHYPHIIEYVSVSNPIVTRIFDTISLLVQGKKYLPEFNTLIDDNTAFFDKVIFSNNKQCSGEVNIVVDSYNTNQSLLNKVKNVQGVLITERIEGVWNLNEIRDYVIDYTKPFYLKSWAAIRENYPIDKVLNQSVLDYNKHWWELESLRDNHLVIRLIFSNFGDNNIQLSTNYSIENEQQSLR